MNKNWLANVCLASWALTNVPFAAAAQNKIAPPGGNKKKTRAKEQDTKRGAVSRHFWLESQNLKVQHWKGIFRLYYLSPTTSSKVAIHVADLAGEEQRRAALGRQPAAAGPRRPRRDAPTGSADRRTEREKLAIFSLQGTALASPQKGRNRPRFRSKREETTERPQQGLPQPIAL